jgi:hypothetical protein
MIKRAKAMLFERRCKAGRGRTPAGGPVRPIGCVRLGRRKTAPDAAPHVPVTAPGAHPAGTAATVR